MMNLRWNVLGASLVISASALAAALPITVRFDCPTTTNSPSPARMALERALDRHPGLVDEVWMTCGRDLDRDAHRRTIKASEEWRRRLEQRGVAVSCQVLTLGHDAWDYEGFAEEDFAVDVDGKRVGRTIFCATSPAVREANRRLAEAVMAELRPVSFWPDDDLRLSKRRNRICFCDRCLALFNGETGRHETRASLKAGLYGKPGDAALRRDWTAFNGRVLARFAAIYREAADKANPACRIGLQTVQAYARYNGASFAPLLEAMSGDGRRLSLRRRELRFPGLTHGVRLAQKR